MKASLLLMIGFCLFAPYSFAQKQTTFKINPGEKVMTAIPREEMYSYPDFTPGNVYFKNDQYSPARLNFNALIGEIQFIDAKGDTLSLANEETIKKVVIKSDTFYYDNGYLKVLSNAGDYKLAQKQMFVFVNRQKLGGFGETSSAGIETYDRLSYKTFFSDLVAQEILILAKQTILYIGDRFHHFKVVNQKSLKDAFPKKQKEYKIYVKENKVDFSNENDVKKLLDFLSRE